MIENKKDFLSKGKRFIKREAKRFMVRYGTKDLNRGGFTRNISETGMCLQTNAVLEPGTRIQLRFELEERTFTMAAQVIWAKSVPSSLARIRRGGMGICFIEPSLDWIQFYNKWIGKTF
jgi:hypothetical protein